MTTQTVDEYPDHLTIVDMEGGDATKSDTSDITTSALEAKINQLFKEQQGGGKKKGSKKASKKKGSKKASKKKGSKKASKKKASKKMSGGKGDANSPALKEWRRLLNHVFKKFKSEGKSMKEAMMKAKKIRDSIIVKDPSMKTQHQKVADAAIKKFDEGH